MAISLRRGPVWTMALGIALCAAGPARPAAEPDVGSARTPVGRLTEAFRARSADETLEARVERVRREASAMGMQSAEPAARGLLLAPALGDEAERAAAAVRLAPGLPAAWGALAQSGSGVAALGDLARGIVELERHLEASLWWRATATRVLAWAGVIGGTLFLLLAAARASLRATHDLSHRLAALRVLSPHAAAAALFAAAWLPALLGEGLFGIAAGAFVLALAWSPARERLALVTAFAVVGLAVHPLTDETGRWIAALRADPDSVAIHRAEVADLSGMQRERLALRAAEDPASAHALALWSRRSGDLEGAERWLEAIDPEAADDAVVLNQLANLRLAEGDEEAAISFYEQALRAEPHAEILFNLAQVHGSRIELARQQQNLEAAHAISPATVRELSELRGEGRLAVDLAWPVQDLRGRMGGAADGLPVAEALRASFGAGRLVESGDAALMAFGALTLLALGIRRRTRPGSRCGGCGMRRCDACSAGDADPALRRCSLCGGLWPAGGAGRALVRAVAPVTLRALPGAAGLSARRPWLGLAACLGAATALAAVVLRAGVVADPMAAGAAGRAALWLLAGLALCVHAAATALALREPT